MSLKSIRYSSKAEEISTLARDIGTQPPPGTAHVEAQKLILSLNPLDPKGNYSATSNNTQLVHWPLMGGLYQM